MCSHIVDPSMTGGISQRTLVVLVDESGRAIGTEDKVAVHCSETPLHLAFSCYGFDSRGRLLVTQRSSNKLMFPGIWTNTCCGHPMPDESMEDAIARRMKEELGLTPSDIQCVLPDFRYKAEMNGLVENEICPVFLSRISTVPAPNPDEVADLRWLYWENYKAHAASRDATLSPWTVLQVAELCRLNIVEDYLRACR